ncbi:MAG: hydroxymethylbilane synthase [Actinomycetota bacterium]|nr:hydroxymethylbilane synthase [Actinomycetota bacterium]
MSLTLATRPSPLAIAQATIVTSALGLTAEALLEVANQTGAGDKERFVRGVEQAVLTGRADLGVHSAKDLPGLMTTGLVIAAVPGRADPRDAWIGPGGSLEEIPEGARVGTSSLRRQAQLKALRPDLEMVDISGNVDTRLAKLEAGEVEGLVLARAGLDRLGRSDAVSFTFDLEQMVPAAGQGSLVVQGRSNGPGLSEAAAIADAGSTVALAAERAAVVEIGADCDSPVGFHATEIDGLMSVAGFAGLADGSLWLRDRVEGDPGRAEELGRELARRMITAGAAEILGSTVQP